jgi:uncharacterized repeat protein (TIGR01451 family)
MQTKYSSSPTRLGAILLFLALFALPLPSFAFVYTVDSTADLVDADTTDGNCNTSANTCTLRAAIQQANAWPGHHTIVLPAGTYALEIAGRGDNTAATGDLDITANLTIRGAGADVTIIDADGIDRVFDIRPGVSVEISGVTITGGHVNEPGGGIRNEGTLVLRDSIVTGNHSEPIGGPAGGGIYHFSSSPTALTLVLERVTVSENRADNTAIIGEVFPVNGGGIAIQGGVAAISHSRILDNEAVSPLLPNAAEGGGIHINGATVDISYTTISGNFANMHGGGIWNFSSGGPASGTSGELTIDNSTISGNTAYQGGGIYDDGAASGAGSPLRITRITNSTISGNITQSPGQSLPPPTSGGGLLLRKPVSLLNTTISGNTAGAGSGIFINDLTQGAAEFKHTIIANLCSPDNSSAFTSLGHNIDSGSTCNLVAANDQAGVNAQLAALAANQGGPTAVQVPNPGSPAIDAGDDGACPEVDQRAFPRPADGNGDSTPQCDIGAVEVTPPGVDAADLAVAVIDSPDPVAVNATLSWTVTVTNQGPDDATGASLAFTLPGGVVGPSAPDCAINGAAVDCALGALAPGDSIIRTISAAPAAVGTLTASATATANQNDPNPANNTAIEQTDVYEPTDILISTSAETTGVVVPAGGGADTSGTINDGDTILAGQPFTYTLTIGNSNAVARNVVVTDTLPPSVTMNSSSPSTGTCTLSAQVLTCILGDLPVGVAVATIDIDVTPNERGLITNRAIANFDGAFATSAPLDEFSINVDTRADLAVSMTGSAGTVLVGADLGYSTIVRNDGPSPATGLVLTFDLDDSLDFTGVALNGWSCAHDSGTVTCTRASLAVDAQSTVTVFTSPNAAGQVTTVATVAGDDTDLNPANNTASVTTTVQQGVVQAPNLSLSLSDNPDPVVAGNNVTYTALVSNIGTDAAASVTVTFSIPATTTWVSGSFGCAPNGDFVICDIGQLNAQQNASVDMVVRTEQVGEIETTATAVDSEGRDTDLTNNTDTESTTVIEAPGPGPSSGSGCFIATAAYGSYLDPSVAVLRALRDDYLMTNAPGRAFVAWYYEVSPPIADYIAGHEGLRTATRWALTPIVYAAQYPAPAALLFGLLLIGGLYRKGTAVRG